MKKLLTGSFLALGLFAMACGGGSSPDAVCKKMGDLAKSEGGEAEEMWKSRMADDCVKELGEMKEKLGADKYGKFADCVMKQDSFSKAFEDCDPDKFE